jgi:hypothetical protein
MSSTGLSSGTDFLRDAAQEFFNNLFQNPPMVLAGEIDKSLNWKPSIHFKINDHLTVVAEASENPYPMIFKLRRQDVLSVQTPISIYCVCPEEAYLADQASAKELMGHGYGLLTVASDGTVQKRSSCIPLVQQINDAEFKNEIAGLPAIIRRRLVESFDVYNHSAASGVADITEVIEGLVLRAGRDAAKKGYIDPKNAKPGKPAITLAALVASSQGQSLAGAIGGVQNHISYYRNSAHHFPKNKKQAYIKYRDCRHGFLDGLKKIKQFKDAMRTMGLSGAL